MINYNIMYLGYLITLLLGIPQSYGNSTMVMMMLIMTMMVIHKKRTMFNWKEIWNKPWSWRQLDPGSEASKLILQSCWRWEDHHNQYRNRFTLILILNDLYLKLIFWWSPHSGVSLSSVRCYPRRHLRWQGVIRHWFHIGVQAPGTSGKRLGTCWSKQPW